MADISDVENAMVDLAASFLGLGENYLAGSAILSPVARAKCRVYRGWPNAPQLDADLSHGIVHVTIFPMAGAARNTTRHLPEWKSGPTTPPTMTASVSGSVVSFDGAGGVGQVAGVRYGSLVDGSAYAYRLLAADTPGSVAAAFAARIPGATASGSDLTLPSDLGAEARIVADQWMWMETRRQEHMICVTAWCSNPNVRDVVAKAIDEGGFGTMLDQWGRLTEQFALPDGSDAFLRYAGSHTDDMPQSENLWRRDIRYRVEYPTTLIQQQPAALFIGGQLVVGESGLSWGDTITSDPQDDNAIVARASVMASGSVSVTQAANTLAASAAA